MATQGRLQRTGELLLTPEFARPTPASFAWFVALSAAILGTAFALGPYPITLFPTDAIHFLVQGDFLVKGYRPYVDYYSMYGPVAPLFAAAGLEEYGVSLWAVVSAQALGAAVFGTMMWKVASNRLPRVWALILALSVELVLISCTPLGKRSWREFSPAMWYNALSFCVMAIVFLYVLVPSRSTRAMSQWIDTLIAAFCIMASLHTKISFFPPIVVVFAVGTVMWPRGPQMRIHGLVAFALAALMIVGLPWLLHGSLLAYIQFIRSMSLSISPIALALRYVHHTRTIGLFLIAMLLVYWIAQESDVLKKLRREWLLCFLMFGAVCATTATCKQDPEALPFLGVLPLGTLMVVITLAREAGRSINYRLGLAACAAALLLVGHDAKNGALSWPLSRMKIKTIEPPVERYPDASNVAVGLASKRVDRQLFALMPKSWVDSTFAALTLLKDAGAKPGQVLHVASIPNGVTIMTDLRYSKGESPWSPVAAAADHTAVTPPIPDFAGDADWILRDMKVSLCWDFLKYHRSDLVRQFDKVGENEYWALYKRRER